MKRLLVKALENSFEMTKEDAKAIAKTVEEIFNGENEQRQVVLGLSDGVNTEVLSGLEEGEEVVLPRASQLPSMSFGG